MNSYEQLTNSIIIIGVYSINTEYIILTNNL